MGPSPYVKVHTKHDFTLEDQSATRGCFHNCTSSSRRSALVRQWRLYMLRSLRLSMQRCSYHIQPVRPSCELTYTLPVRQRSAEDTEKGKKTSAAEKKGKYLSRPRRGSKLVFLVPPPLLPLRFFWEDLK